MEEMNPVINSTLIFAARVKVEEKQIKRYRLITRFLRYVYIIWYCINSCKTEMYITQTNRQVNFTDALQEQVMQPSK